VSINLEYLAPSKLWTKMKTDLDNGVGWGTRSASFVRGIIEADLFTKIQDELDWEVIDFTERQQGFLAFLTYYVYAMTSSAGGNSKCLLANPKDGILDFNFRSLFSLTFDEVGLGEEMNGEELWEFVWKLTNRLGTKCQLANQVPVLGYYFKIPLDEIVKAIPDSTRDRNWLQGLARKKRGVPTINAGYYDAFKRDLFHFIHPSLSTMGLQKIRGEDNSESAIIEFRQPPSVCRGLVSPDKWSAIVEEVLKGFKDLNEGTLHDQAKAKSCTRLHPFEIPYPVWKTVRTCAGVGGQC